MTVSRHRTREIDPVHKPTAQQRSQRVRIIRQNDLSHLRLRIPHRPRHHHLLVHSPLSSSGFSSTRGGLRDLVNLPLLKVRFQKTLRHPLHAAVVMRMLTFSLPGIKLERPVLGRTMLALAYVANLNATANTVSFTHGPGRKSDRISHPLPRQPPATLRIPKITELPQFFLRRRLTLMPRRRAVAAPPASQRKPTRMQPDPVL